MDWSLRECVVLLSLVTLVTFIQNTEANIRATTYCSATQSPVGCRDALNSSVLYDCPGPGEYPHPLNCTMFMKCHGDFFFGCECDCPTGNYSGIAGGQLYFDTTTKNCLPPLQAQCSTGIPGIGTTGTGAGTGAQGGSSSGSGSGDCSCSDSTAGIVLGSLATALGTAATIMSAMSLHKARKALGETGSPTRSYKVTDSNGSTPGNSNGNLNPDTGTPYEKDPNFKKQVAPPSARPRPLTARSIGPLY